ncbi:MAG: choice-of-anchor B family protein [Rhodothermales bacterium]
MRTVSTVCSQPVVFTAPAFRAFCAFLVILSCLAFTPATTLAQSGSYGVAVVLDGGELFVGEPNTSFREGSVYIYERSASRWAEVQRLTAPNASRADGFGTVLAKHGATLVAGQRGGPLHVFEKGATSGWRHVGMVSGPGTAGLEPECNHRGYCGTDFGLTLALNEDWLLAGSSERVHAYRRGADGSFTYHSAFQHSSATPEDRFGATLLLVDGRALVGAPDWDDTSAGLQNVGRVTEFRLLDDTWTETGVLPFFSESAASFGSALSMENGQLLVGAPGAHGTRGAVYSFTRQTGQAREGRRDEPWAPERIIQLPDGQPGDLFGSSVAHAAEAIWVGAPTLRGNETGSAFVLGRNADGSLDTPERIQLTGTVERDAFGSTIVVEGPQVVVSAPGMHHQAGALSAYAPNEEPQRMLSPPDVLGALTGEERQCVDGKIGPFDCDEVELLSFLPNDYLRAPENARGVRVNDNWGWTDPDTGREYALIARTDGVSFVDVTDPLSPVLIGDLPKPWGTPPSPIWRDIKTFRNHAYIVADGAGDHGLQIFDLTRLRGVTEPPALFEPDVHYTGIASSHNVIINEDTGFAYTIDRPTCGGGLYMMDINNPLDPVFVGCAKGGNHGTHDTQCVTYTGPDQRYTGHELCLNSNGAEFEIMDVTDKAHPVSLSTASSPAAAYIHQGWLSDDQRYFYQNDEADVLRGNVDRTRTLIWDLADLEDPILVNEFMGSMPASAHNLYIKDGFMYQANYRYGMHVLDISDPVHPVEVGSFDTTPYLDGPGFSGAWSTYPFFESGTVIVTSKREGMFLLRGKKKTEL